MLTITEVLMLRLLSVMAIRPNYDVEAKYMLCTYSVTGESVPCEAIVIGQQIAASYN